MNLFFKNEIEKAFIRDVTDFEYIEDEDGKQIIFWKANGEGERFSCDFDRWSIMTETEEISKYSNKE